MPDRDKDSYEGQQAILSELTGRDVGEIDHYAAVTVSEEGKASVVFCCDRREAAMLLMSAATTLTTVRGTSGRADGKMPPIGEDN